MGADEPERTVNDSKRNRLVMGATIAPSAAIAKVTAITRAMPGRSELGAGLTKRASTAAYSRTTPVAAIAPSPTKSPARLPIRRPAIAAA